MRVLESIRKNNYIATIMISCFFMSVDVFNIVKEATVYV